MRYYVESDGRVFLIERGGVFDLPEPAEVPFPVDRIAPLAGPDEVWFCVPRIDRHPSEWPSKDDLATLPATTCARLAVHATMPRIVVEGVCIRDDEILLVKGNRGLTDGIWTLPGGFLRFGETPAEGVVREIREEVGLVGTIEGAPIFQSKLGERSRLHWMMVFYRVAIDGDPMPNPDEIAEARFIRSSDARTMLSEGMATAVLEVAGRPQDGVV